MLEPSGADRLSIDERHLRDAVSDGRGVPLAGRRREYALLADAGAQDLPWGRLYEGHVNALQLIGRLGTGDVRARAAREAQAGGLFGVWNTEADDGVAAFGCSSSGFTLRGRKTFASGAGRVMRALITVRFEDDGKYIVVVPMDRVRTTIDTSFWAEPFGMEASDSFAVDFAGVRLAWDARIGPPDAYEQSPWLLAGASRFLAVQAGALCALVRDFGDFIKRRGAEHEPLQLNRFGEAVTASRTAELWVGACLRAWTHYDAAPNEAATNELLETVDLARSAVERAALDVLERIERGVGARGLLQTEPFARRIRDLRMYLRQPAVDAVVLRAAQAALRGNGVSSRSSNAAATLAGTEPRGTSGG